MSKKHGNILIVDDDEDILTAGRILLRRKFASVVCCQRPEEIPGLMEQHDFDTVLLDMNFGPGESSGRQGFEWLEKILEIDPETVVVMITAHGNVDTAVAAIKRGATDFVAKPWENQKVVATVSAAVELRRSRRESESLREANRILAETAVAGDNSIVSESIEMRDVLDLVARAAPTDVNVLILGENGTGKELIARELHRQSQRADRVFLSVDMGSIAETLFEAELFGHKKGAFTGANEDRLGRFQAANGGTLFLDEIGNLPLHLQAKLLGALEQRRVTPVGSDKPENVDVRVISATNISKGELHDTDRFRPDLLFRLNTVEVTIPPLRDRIDDILPIAHHFADLYSRKYGQQVRAFSPAARAALIEYDWPGNVRALRHAIERAVILTSSEYLEPSDLQLVETPAPNQRRRSAPAAAEEVAADGDAQSLDEMEKTAIERVLRKHGFNISHAAKELGLTRASLYRRMEKHGI